MAAKKKASPGKKGASKKKAIARRRASARKAPARKKSIVRARPAAKKKAAARKKAPAVRKKAPTARKKAPAARNKAPAAPKKKPAARRKAVSRPTGIIQKITSIFTSTPASPPPLNIDTESLPAFTVGQPDKVSIAASGGTPPYRFQLTQGTLPPDLQFNSFGTLFGTAQQSGDTTIFIKVTDSASPQGQQTQAFDLQVLP